MRVPGVRFHTLLRALVLPPILTQHTLVLVLFINAKALRSQLAGGVGAVVQRAGRRKLGTRRELADDIIGAVVIRLVQAGILVHGRRPIA